MCVDLPFIIPKCWPGWLSLILQILPKLIRINGCIMMCCNGRIDGWIVSYNPLSTTGQKARQTDAYDEEALFRSKMKHRMHRWTEVIQSVDKGMIFYSGDAGHFVHYDDPELLIASIRIVLHDYQVLQESKQE